MWLYEQKSRFVYSHPFLCKQVPILRFFQCEIWQCPCRKICWPSCWWIQIILRLVWHNIFWWWHSKYYWATSYQKNHQQGKRAVWYCPWLRNYRWMQPVKKSWKGFWTICWLRCESHKPWYAKCSQSGAFCPWQTRRQGRNWKSRKSGKEKWYQQHKPWPYAWHT